MDKRKQGTKKSKGRFSNRMMLSLLLSKGSPFGSELPLHLDYVLSHRKATQHPCLKHTRCIHFELGSIGGMGECV